MIARPCHEQGPVICCGQRDGLAAAANGGHCMFTTSRGFRIRYQVFGDGPALLLLHGLAMWGDRWRDNGYIDALQGQFRLIVPDHLGHGESDKPHDPAAYGPANLAADALAVMDAEGAGRAHVWGFSMGVTVAEALAAAAPERVLSLILGGHGPGLTEQQRCELLDLDPLPADWDDLFGDGLPQAVIEMFREHNKDFGAIRACVAGLADGATTIGELQAAGHKTLAYMGGDEVWVTEEPWASLYRRNCEALAAQIEIVPGGHAEAFRQSQNILPQALAHLKAAAPAPA
jgi:pimeloyl-ACP methyl ester carboxylesterase